jgi:3,4-dihydroxy 2-butanone 4-phosphate synthase/GTP cyclohydrolase II
VVGGEHLSSLHGALADIATGGRGVVVVIRETSKTAISERIRQMVAGTKREVDLRNYGIGAQILVDLGVKNLVLLSNTKRHIVGVEGYGLNVVEQRHIGETK